MIRDLSLWMYRPHASHIEAGGAVTVRRAVMGVSMLLLSGCASIPSVGPDYQEPADIAPKSWLTTEATASPNADKRLVPDWWGLFQDEGLNELVRRAVERSPDLKLARARVREARAALRIATAGFYPQIDAGGSFQRNDPSDSSFQGFSRSLSPYNQYSAGFDASWEIDLFGGLRREREAAVATLEASDATYADTMITLLSDVASTYFSIRAIDKRLAVNKRNLDAQSESLSLVKARYDAGLVSELDVAQATALLEATRAQIPQLEDTRVSLLTGLSILLGEFPESTEEFFASRPKVQLLEQIGRLPPEVPVGLPSDLLRRRPDIRALERSLAAQTARVGVAVSDLFPKFSLTGQFGYASFDSGSLFDKTSRQWSISPALQLPLFRGGSIRGNIDVQDQRMQQALAQYEKGVLSAVAETETALSTYRRQKERQVALRAAYQASERASELSRELYTQGIADFQRVLDAERAALLAEDSFVVAEESAIRALIAIYKALGGGWDRSTVDFESTLFPQHKSKNGATPVVTTTPEHDTSHG